MKKITALLALFSVVMLTGLGCKGPTSKYETKLEIWGTFDNSYAYNESLAAYDTVNKNVISTAYQKHTLESYKTDLLSALAAGTGPDVFMIHNSWMPDFIDKIVPAPEYMMTERDFRENFVDVVADDLVVDGQIYGVALSVDSLGLYYNKDIFNSAGITRPPQTWEDFNDVVQKLSQIDEYGNITQSAAAMGTAFNINRSSDLLSVLMIQNGAEMSLRKNDGTTAMSFGESVQGSGIVPGEYALEYYTDFASVASPLYTWNKNQNYSIDDFFQGKTAMMINYSYHYDTIKAKNAKLNFAVADLPQISMDTVGDQANYANYWVFVVAKNKQPTQSNDENAVQVTNEMRIHESWQLLTALSFPSTNGVTITNYVNGESLVYPVKFDLTEKYLEQTGKPAARRDLIDMQINDVRLGAFARGNLIAKTWWRHDADAIDAIFADMIDNVNTGELSVNKALELGAQRSRQLQ
jgi:ABC-type glycerol-3-phosphate transport system substrate-binding protein